MSKKTVLYAMLILVLAVSLSACQRSASSEPVGTPTAGSASQGPVETSSDPMEMLRRFATQTAQAMSGTVQPVGVTTTPYAGTPQATVANGTPAVAFTPVFATQTSIPNTAVPPVTTKPSSYTLQEGEYPFCIARRFNVDQSELLSINGLSSSGQYYPGLVLKIPQTGNPFVGARSLLPRPAKYTVLSGDTIYGIACKYGDTDPIINIAAANNLVAPYTLKTGTILTIP
jgi:LysM repeat protein